MSAELWRPAASIKHLKLRATVLRKIRCFFEERDVLEVETPLLARYSVTDPYMQALTVDAPIKTGERFYLQTSPEYAMKRLLASGSGAIYQMAKAFRGKESGSYHNPEFTMLEWYRPGFNYFQLMDEVAQLLVSVLGIALCQKISYRNLFQQHLQIDPHLCDCNSLQQIARQHLDVQMHSECRDDWLNLLMAEVIEPLLEKRTLTFIYNYPVSQAALAHIANDDMGVAVAQRFELYVGGVELANGYDELLDVKEQQRRFQHDQRIRQQYAKPAIESDKFLLAAMEQAGLPQCSGVALGVDRLVMLALDCPSINDVLAFPVDRA